MKYTVYQTTCKINGKIYIGKHQTEDPYDDYLGSGKLLHRAIESYGRENFKKEVLHIFDNEEDMNAKEAELVTEEFVKEDTNYNLCPGGQGGWGFLNDGSNEHRDRASRAASTSNSYKWSESRKRVQRDHLLKLRALKKISAPNWTGRKHSEETKKKIGATNSQCQTGKGNSQFGTMWITDGNRTKKIKKADPIPNGWKRGRKLRTPSCREVTAS